MTDIQVQVVDLRRRVGNYKERSSMGRRSRTEGRKPGGKRSLVFHCTIIYCNDHCLTIGTSGRRTKRFVEDTMSTAANAPPIFGNRYSPLCTGGHAPSIPHVLFFQLFTVTICSASSSIIACDGQFTAFATSCLPACYCCSEIILNPLVALRIT